MHIIGVLEAHKRWATGEDGGTRANLRGADLWGASLRNANLRGANLRGADLWGASLRNANLREADLRNAKLRYADLRNANLRNANLRDANLRDANLRNANLMYANLMCADLRNADLRNANLRDANLWGCIGNGAQVKTLILGTYTVTYTKSVLQIGCERHKITEWWGFDDETIANMDTAALSWWKKHKELLKQTIETCPAEH